MRLSKVQCVLVVLRPQKWLTRVSTLSARASPLSSGEKVPKVTGETIPSGRETEGSEGRSPVVVAGSKKGANGLRVPPRRPECGSNATKTAYRACRGACRGRSPFRHSSREYYFRKPVAQDGHSIGGQGVPGLGLRRSSKWGCKPVLSDIKPSTSAFATLLD